MNNIFSQYLFFIVPFLIFAFVLPIFSVVIMPSIIVLLVKKFINKSLPYKHFLPYILSVTFFAVIGALIWEKGVFNHIYYEWDRIYFPAFNLLYHESPVLDGSASWIAQEWSLRTLDILYYFMLFCVYFLAVIFSFWYLRKEPINIRQSFFKTIITSSVILFSLAVIVPPLEKMLAQFLPYGNQNLKRVENATSCVDPIEKDRILYGGDLADHISSKDGSNMKEFWKTTYSGVSSGIPSPDGERVAYLEKDGIWIKCTEGEGQILIPFKGATINNKDFSASGLMSIPYWSPDGKNLIVNYYGDVVRVNVVTKEKTTLKQKVAFKNYGIDPTRPRPSGFYGIIFEVGTVFWGKDNSIYYTQFGDNVALHKLDPQTGQDSILLQSSYPLSISNTTQDGKLVIIESDWQGVIDFHAKSYVYNLVNSKQEDQLYGFKVDNEGITNTFNFSKDGRYLLFSNAQYGLIDTDNYAQFTVLDLNTSKKYDIKTMVKDYLKKEGRLKDGIVVSIDVFDWSSQNELLLDVRFENDRTRKSYVLKLDGTITPISTESSLIPNSWL